MTDPAEVEAIFAIIGDEKYNAMRLCLTTELVKQSSDQIKMAHEGGLDAELVRDTERGQEKRPHD